MRTIEELMQILRDNPPLVKYNGGYNGGMSRTITHTVRDMITDEELIALHRHMWNWIADESEKRGEYATKIQYMDTFNLWHNTSLNCHNMCFACLYATKKEHEEFKTPIDCKKCPFIWYDREKEEEMQTNHAMAQFYGYEEEIEIPPCCETDAPYESIQDITIENPYYLLPEYEVPLEEYVKKARMIANLPLKRTVCASLPGTQPAN